MRDKMGWSFLSARDATTLRDSAGLASPSVPGQARSTQFAPQTTRSFPLHGFDQHACEVVHRALSFFSRRLLHVDGSGPRAQLLLYVACRLWPKNATGSS